MKNLNCIKLLSLGVILVTPLAIVSVEEDKARQAKGVKAFETAIEQRREAEQKKAAERIAEAKQLRAGLFEQEKVKVEEQKAKLEKHRKLVAAIKANNSEKVKQLLDEGVSVGQKAMDLAKKGGNLEIIGLLRDGLTQELIKYLEFSMPRTRRVELYIERGADVQGQNKEGKTPLMAAADPRVEAGRRETIKVLSLLIKKGAKVNAQDNEGRTALMMAANPRATGHPGDALTVETLMYWGADANIVDNKGLKAVDYAGESTIKEALEKHGAKSG